MDFKKDIIRNDRNIFLYFTAIIVHLTSFTTGVAFCWSNPVSSKLQSTDDNPLGTPLLISEISWLASLVSLGAVVGPFAGGYLADCIGRKYCLMLTAVLADLSFATLAFGNNLYLYYIARFIGGLCVGIFLTVLPMYIGEVAEIHNRGQLGGLTGVFIVSGNMFCFSVGPYISIQLFSLSCMIAPTIFLIVCLLLIPESPCYLIIKGKHEEAKLALQKLRTGNVDNELTDLTATVKESSAASGGISDIFKSKNLRRGLVVTVGLMITQQLTAISAIILYLPKIFQDSGSSMSKEVATIVVGGVQIIATLFSSQIVDKLGRKPLVFISSIATSASLFTLAIYFCLLIYIDVSSISWLPVVALITFMFFYNIGIGPLPITILGEIFPPHVKSAASSITIAGCFMFSFGVAKLFPTLVDLLENWCAFLFFAVSNAIAIVLLWFQMPETKGRTLAEILESLK